MRHPLIRLSAASIALLALASCAMFHHEKDEGSEALEHAGPWKALFDGGSTAAFRDYHGTTISPDWQVVDGTLTKTKPTEDLITKDQYGDFELTLEWKMGPGGNSGIFYRATEDADKIYWTAPEYQLLDDARHPDGKNPLTSAGASYGLYPAPRGVVKPANEWNSTRIVAKGNHVEHWLNGVKMVEFELFSPDWMEKFKASKFKDLPKWARAPRGFIGIQGDHDGVLALRNIRIREL